MRILMINHEFTVSGASKAFLRLALALKAAGHAITLFPSNPAHGPMRDAFVAGGIPIREEIRDPSFDLAIANTICTAPAIIEIGGRIRTVWWIHEAEVGLDIILQNPSCVRAFPFATAIVFQTSFQRDDIYRPFLLSRHPSDIFIIPNAIPTVPDDPTPSPAVAPAGDGVFRVISVGTIEPRKRHGDLINAVARLPRLAIDCVICGRYFELDAQAAAIVQRAPSRYRLLGELPEAELRAWVKSADVFCLPSGSESQPLAVYEAAALGKPLVLSDLPSYRGVFAHGRQAIMVPVGDIDLLAMALEGLASRPELRTRLGAAARDAVRSNTEDRFLSAFENVLRFAA